MCTPDGKYFPGTISSNAYTFDGKKMQLRNYAISAAANFTLTITNIRNGGNYRLRVKKTVSGDVVMTVSGASITGSAGSTITITGAVNTYYTYEILNDGTTTIIVSASSSGGGASTAYVDSAVAAEATARDSAITTAVAAEATARAAAVTSGIATAEAYADGLVVGLWDDRGNFDASGGAYPSSGGSGAAGAIKKGDIWTISVAGTLPTSQVVEIGDTVRAKQDTPGNTQANWAIQQNNIGYVAENSANKDTSGGYVGLSGWSIKFRNLGNTFTSLLQNSATAARTYTFPDRTGTIADDTDITSAKARGNHTGTQTASTISDFNAAALAAAPAETTTTEGALINAATSKSTPVDADYVGLMDSAASNVLKKLSWANIKATLKTYLDTLYGPSYTYYTRVFEEDFLDSTLSSRWSTALSGTGTGVSISQTDSAKHPGVAIVNIGTTTSGEVAASLRMFNGTNQWNPADGALKMSMVVKTPSVAPTAGAPEDWLMFYGLLGNDTYGADGIYFYPGATGTWKIAMSKAGSTQTVDTAIASSPDTWYGLEFSINAAQGTLTWKINGSTGSFTPTYTWSAGSNSMIPRFLFYKWAGTASLVGKVDYLRIEQTHTSY